MPNVWQERKASVRSFECVDLWWHLPIPSKWLAKGDKSKPVCRLKLCTWWSTGTTRNLSLLKAANICLTYCNSPKDLKGTFYLIHDCLHLTVLPLLVTLTTSYTQNLLFKGYVRALGNFSHCVGVYLSSKQRLQKLERSQNPWFLACCYWSYKLKPYITLQRWSDGWAWWPPA